MGTIPDNLPENDKALVEAVEKGEAWQKHKPIPTLEQLADPAFVAQMPTIQATTIRALCLGLWEGVAVDPIGVHLWGAKIEGTLNLSLCTVCCPIALMHCHFAARVDLVSATLPLLSLGGSRLEGGLFGDDLQVKGDLICSGVMATDLVQICDARIGRDLDFRNAVLESESIPTLNVGGGQIDGSVLCSGSFSIDGDAWFMSAKVGEEFDWRPSRWNGELNIADCRIARWRDAWRGTEWKCHGAQILNIENCEYAEFAGFPGFPILSDILMSTDARARIRWIQESLPAEFRLGHYDVLAAALRRAGDDRGARYVALRKHRDQTWRLGTVQGPRSFIGWLVRFVWGNFLDVTIGYGYRPWLGIVWLTGFLAVGTWLFSVHAPTNVGGSGVIELAVPTALLEPFEGDSAFADGGSNPVTLEDRDTEATNAVWCNQKSAQPPFNAFWHSFDTLVPLISLGQETAWQPSPHGVTWVEDRVGWSVLSYLYVYKLAGWVLSTLILAALIGFIGSCRESGVSSARKF